MIIAIGQFSQYMAQFLDYMRNIRHLSPRTIESYRRDLTQFCNWLTELTDTSIRLDHSLVSRYIYYQSQQRKLHPSSVNRALSALKSMIRYLIVSAADEFSVADQKELQKLLLYIKGSRIPTRLPVDLPLEQLVKLIPEARDFLTARDAALIETLYSSGCRISELLSIDVEQLLRSPTRVRIRGKGAVEREVYFGEAAQRAIERYLPFRRVLLTERAAESDRTEDVERAVLFINRRGQRLTRQGANVALKRYVGALPMKQRISAHTFRHSFATHLLDAGADIRTVQELLGHAQLSSTQIYTHVSVAKMQKAYRQAHPHAFPRRSSVTGDEHRGRKAG